MFTSLAAVGLFVFILLTGNVLKEIAGLLAAGQLTGQMFFELLLLLVPYVFAYALPLGILSGILIVMGRLSADREIVALKSAGLSLWRISAPIFAVALVGVAVALFINNYYAPDAKLERKEMLANVVREDPLRFIVPKQFIKDFPGYVLYVGAKDGKQLEDFWIWELDEQNRAVRLLRAVKGEFSYDAPNDTLILTLSEGFSELRSERNPDDLQSIRPTVAFREARIRLPLERLLGTRRQYTSLSALNLNRLIVKKAGYESQLAELANDDPSARAKTLVEKVRVQLQIQENFAMAFSVLSLTLIGVPLGIRAGRRETYANIALALILAMVYYFLVIVVVGWLERQPALRPDLLVWLPNFLFQGLGLWLLARANRH